MSILWVDPCCGLAGDVWVGGFAALGVPVADLKAVLRGMPFPELDCCVEEVMRCGVRATRARILIAGLTDEGRSPHLHLSGRGGQVRRGRGTSLVAASPHPRATWSGIDALLARHLPPRIAEPARDAFHRLATAEAAAHGLALDRVRFHQAGTPDSIADVVLACAGWVFLGEPEVHMGPIALGRGHLQLPGGLHPIPGPAARTLLEGFETHPGSAPEDYELCTPTGAALAAALTTHRGAPSRLRDPRAAFSAGSYDFPHTPAVCRWVLGRLQEP